MPLNQRIRFVLPAILSMVLASCAGGGRPAWTFAPRAVASHGGAAASTSQPSQIAAVATPASPTSPEPASGDVVGSITVHAFDLGFDPKTVDVATPGLYDVSLINDGASSHDITFPDGTKLVANGGESVAGTVTIPQGGLKFICSIPGHADAGMVGEVMVSGTAVASPTPPASAVPGSPGPSEPPSHGSSLPSVEGVEPDPNAAPYKLYDAKAPAALPGTVHDIDLVMTEGLMTVAPGYVVNAWTFGGAVPGPVIRVKVGDTIRVHLKNPATNQVAHSIDFHSSQVAWNDEMRSINPGEELLYEWTADYAGVWMYHCGTAPALHHIANGMYGMVIVEPKEGLPKVDHEFAIVQSEWYIGGQGQPASLPKAGAAVPAPDFVVFNGVANQYMDHPLQVGTGDSVRFFVLDAGPSVDSSFHIVGTIFDRVIKEGVQLTPDNPGHYGAQAVDLSPAQGAIIELTTKEDGLYPIVTHAFNLVGRGALGILQAGDGDPGS